jgi:hypothetical protein
MIAIVIAIFMPLKMAGSANGNRTITNDCHSDAVSERQSRNAEASVLENPTGRYHHRKEADKSGKCDARFAADSEPDDK